MRRLRVQHLSRPVDWPTEDTDEMGAEPAEDTDERPSEPAQNTDRHVPPDGVPDWFYYNMEALGHFLLARWRAMNG